MCFPVPCVCPVSGGRDAKTLSDTCYCLPLSPSLFFRLSQMFFFTASARGSLHVGLSVVQFRSIQYGHQGSCSRHIQNGPLDFPPRDWLWHPSQHLSTSILYYHMPIHPGAQVETCDRLDPHFLLPPPSKRLRIQRLCATEGGLLPPFCTPPYRPFFK